MRFWKVIVISVAVNVFVTSAALFVYNRYFAREIVVLDLAAYVQKLRTDFLKGKVDDAGLRKRFRDLDALVEGISKRKVILSREAVIAGGRDISDEVIGTQKE